MNERVLGPADFVRLTGASPADAERICAGGATADLRYAELDREESARIAAEVEEVINHRALRTVGGDDSRVWQDGWREVAESLKGRAITVDSLRPQYFRGEPICRMEGRYVRGLSPAFEYDTGLVLRRLIFDKYLRDAETIVEFGCGTGINLLLMSELFPRSRFIGCDWAEPSRDILAEMARQTGRPIVGHLFNMLTAEGWEGAEIDGKAVVVTVHAMEQLGLGWRPFVDYIRHRRPALCLHIEPILELYEPDSPFDEQARRYHRKRNYLAGFYPHVMELAQTGRAKVSAARRVPFGGLHHEAYSILAWTPLG